MQTLLGITIMTDENGTEEFDMDALLDSTLDDLADLPVTKAWPTGCYKASLTITSKVISGKGVMVFGFSYLDVLDDITLEGDEEAPKVTDTCDALFFMNSDFGQGKYKAMVPNLYASLNCASPRQLIEQCQGIEVMVVAERTPDKKNPSRKYFAPLSIDVC